jgi:hypothetical protein
VAGVSPGCESRRGPRPPVIRAPPGTGTLPGRDGQPLGSAVDAAVVPVQVGSAGIIATELLGHARLEARGHLRTGRRPARGRRGRSARPGEGLAQPIADVALLTRAGNIAAAKDVLASGPQPQRRLRLGLLDLLDGIFGELPLAFHASRRYRGAYAHTTGQARS